MSATGGRLVRAHVKSCALQELGMFANGLTFISAYHH
jgi:hypothetical protein